MRMSFITVVAFLTLTHSVNAEDTPVPGAEHWTLSYDKDYNLCTVAATYERSSTYIGFVSLNYKTYFLLANLSWEIPENSRYVISIRFDGKRWYKIPFESLTKEIMGAELYKLGEKEFRYSSKIEIYGESGNLVGNYSLKGSNIAIDYVKKCGLLAGMGGDGNSPYLDTNPFAKKSNNPFE